MKTTPILAADGFNKVQPISEGYVVKGGINTTSRIVVRPPAPAPMRPASPAVPVASVSSTKATFAEG